MLFDAISLCWGVFIVTWALGALYNARYAPRTVGRDGWLGLRWRDWLVAGAVVVLVTAFVPRSVLETVVFRSDGLSNIGLIVLVGSTLFTLWARWTLGKMWSPVPSLRDHHELHTDGPYRFTRHPIYTGILGMLLGTVLIAAFGGSIVALVVFSGVFLVRIPREEKLMLQTFGEQYVRYQREVPRLVPLTRWPGRLRARKSWPPRQATRPR